MRKQGEALEDHREFVSAERFKRLLIEGQDVSLAHVDQARRRFDQSVEVADQGRLAGAGKTHDDEDFAFLDREVDVSETDRMTSLRQACLYSVHFGPAAALFLGLCRISCKGWRSGSAV